MYTGKNVLITGGLGFIGSNLAHALAGMGSNVTIVDCRLNGTGWNMRNVEGLDIEIIIDDIANTDKKILEDNDIIFNLAGSLSHTKSMEAPLKDFMSNVHSQAAFLDKCRHCSAKIVYTSTRSVYGKPQYLPVDENHPLNPPDANGVNKMAAEMYHTYYAKFYGMPVCCLRLTNVFGQRHQMRHSEQGVLNWFMRQAMDGKKIKVYGGMQKRDFLYVDDAVDALLLFGIKGEGIFNIGSGIGISLKDAAEKIVSITGSGSVEICSMPAERKAIEVGDFVADISKASRLWKPKTSFENGIRKTADFYKKEKAFYW